MIVRSIFTKPYAIPLLLFLIAFTLRTIALDKIPIGIVNDNMVFVLNAKAFFYTGHDVTGQWNPFSLTPLPDEPAQAELPYIYLSPIIGPLPSSLFAAHIFYAIANSLFVVVLYLLVKKLLHEKIALIVGLIACFNPWAIFFGRSAFETSLAVFFYLLAFYVLVNTSGWKKLLTFIPLALGFYTYMAYKVTLIPYVAIISLFAWIQVDHRKYLKQYLTLFLLCLGITSLFLFNAYQRNTINRLNEATFYSASDVSNQVNFERRMAIKNPFYVIFSNKAFVATKYIIGKYIGAFSANNLFVDSERLLRFHIYNHGHFYYIDFIFLILGFCYLLARNRKLWILLTSIILISPLPTIVSNEGITYVMRSSLYIPFLYIYIGVGIWSILTIKKSKAYLMISSLLIGGIYVLLIGNFLYTYFFIQPVFASEAQAFSSRLMSRYIQLANSENKKTSVLLGNPKNQFKNYIIYSNIYSRQTSEEVKNAFLRRNYRLKNVTFITCDELETIEKNSIYIFDAGKKCTQFINVKNTLSIVQLSDSGAVYNIYQDSICSKFNLKPYVANLTFNDLAVEKLSPKNFCETFIIKYPDIK
ncbi:MAG: hypothetical protein HYV39_01635 [Candidatus Levybacteria bacterium]|nr:hypothetical protein [Candidatus Levybacteria bacterium]